ncbi:MAG: alpha/beta fold hydrolase [Christensenella sp.]|nr:alpha/beta fold hydrolase [Christensenella sp.]
MESSVQRVSKPKRAGRVWKIFGAIVLGLLLLLYVLFPVCMGSIASVRKPQAAELPPDGYEAVAITAQDGTPLAGWYAAGENGACILLIHGSNENLASITDHVTFLRSAGYGVFALTLRGHGGSGGRGNALGWDCGQDVSSAVSYLRDKGVSRIGALGLSLGGEVLLASAANEPELRAIVSDGATYHSLADYLELPDNRSLWRSWTIRVMYASTALFTGQRPPERSILESVEKAADTKFLLIAAGNVLSESAYGALYETAANGRAELWTVPNAGHTQGLFVSPEEYRSRVLAFFQETLAEVG